VPTSAAYGSHHGLVDALLVAALCAGGGALALAALPFSLLRPVPFGRALGERRGDVAAIGVSLLVGILAAYLLTRGSG
jgi:hypothetical protein